MLVEKINKEVTFVSGNVDEIIYISLQFLEVFLEPVANLKKYIRHIYVQPVMVSI